MSKNNDLARIEASNEQKQWPFFIAMSRIEPKPCHCHSLSGALLLDVGEARARYKTFGNLD